MALITLAAAVVMALSLSRRLQQPLDRLLAGTQALQAGALDHRIATGSRDEFDHVAQSFNAMARELQSHRAAADAARHDLEVAVHDRTRELSAAHDTLKQLDERRRQLFADLGHELRTPATAIRGEAEIALRGKDKPTAEYRQALGRVISGIDQMTGLIHDLMLIAKAEADQLVMKPTSTDLPALLAEAVDQARTLGAAHRVDVQLDRLGQAVMIVLDNAVRYSPEGASVAVSLRTDPSVATIVVSDAGIGIDADELPHVFERFVRGQRARAHARTAPASACRLHSPSCMRMPGRSMCKASPCAARPFASPCRSLPPTRLNGPCDRMNILVVEDDARVADFLLRGLRAEGYRVELARNGADGLAMARTTEPAILILDLMLPGLSGLELCQTLRAEGHHVPVLILSALGNTADKVQGLRLGADDYLTKPFAFEELLARIEALMRRGREQKPRSTLLHVADLTLDLERMSASRAGQTIALTAKELALLELLMNSPGRVYSRERILSNVWGTSQDPLTNVVDVYVRRLRAKIDDGHPLALIKTVRGFGYRLDDVRE
jgi:DNA-binding response OmpR family regulator/signal transduction histidine kinase